MDDSKKIEIIDEKNSKDSVEEEGKEVQIPDLDSKIKGEVDLEKKIYPCIALRGVSIFPETTVHFDIGREKSIKALEKAMSTDKLLFVSSQIDDGIMIPTFKDIYTLGTIVRVKQMLKVKGDVIRVLVDGLTRAEIDEINSGEDIMACTVKKIPEHIEYEFLTVEEIAKLRMLSEKFIEYSTLSGHIPDEVVDNTLASKDPIAVINRILIQLAVPTVKKQYVYEREIFEERVDSLLKLIEHENEISMEEKKLSQKVKDSIDKGQREYYLKEKLKAIQNELGEGDDPSEDAEGWLKSLHKLKLDKKIEEKVEKEIERYSKMSPSSAESAVIRTYVETILELPWKKSSKVTTNLKKAEKILEAEHYGLEDIKERIIEYLAVIHLSKAIKGPIICLVGPPGVGKTSIAKSIAKATGREYFRMSLGGVRDEAEIRGHRRTYIGAIPGSIINGIKVAGTNNPLFLLDEIDKIGDDFKGDPASALLEALDPEQNMNFTDHYLEIPFDLSKVLFITTANTLETIPRPLLDRMEVIEISGYTEEEKVQIAKRYLIPKNIKNHGLKQGNASISENAVHDIINYYTRESGVRNLERKIQKICRKVAKNCVMSKKKSYNISSRNLSSYLGNKKYRFDTVKGKSEIGVVTGMAWTQVGGDTLNIETAVTKGSGKLQLTGQLGDVMQESAKAAFTYIRSIADELGIKGEFYKDSDIHVHVPEGAVPKDGPSAGVTIFTALVSALTSKPVYKDVAMTGEITLRGNILPVGGIKEKVLAAHRAGIKTILLPEENIVDLEKIPRNIKREIKFVPLKSAKEALKYAMEK